MDERDPRPCPACGETCVYDGWEHVHRTGLGIGSCRSTGRVSWDGRCPSCGGRDGYHWPGCWRTKIARPAAPVEKNS